ncbi:MAG: glycosyltransferase family 2 protein [Bacteroidota bacterium]
MPDHPLVYCVVLNCGLRPDGSVRKLLLETLDSVTKMSYPNFKIVVTDNGSTDGSQDAVRQYYPDVTLVEIGKNLGFSKGASVGLKYAYDNGCDWVFLLNNDIKLDSEILTEMMKVGTADPKVGIVGPKIYYFTDPDKIWYAGGKVNFFTGIISHRGLREIDTGQYDRVEETGYITGCAILIRREVMQKIGFFDPIFTPMYSEDADYSLRAREAGYKLMYAPQGKLWHKVSSFSGGGLTPLKTRLKVEHNLIVFKRHAKWYHWLTIPFCIAGGTIWFVLKQILSGNFTIIIALFQGFVKAIGSLFSRAGEAKEPGQ